MYGLCVCMKTYSLLICNLWTIKKKKHLSDYGCERVTCELVTAIIFWSILKRIVVCSSITRIFLYFVFFLSSLFVDWIWYTGGYSSIKHRHVSEWHKAYCGHIVRFGEENGHGWNSQENGRQSDDFAESTASVKYSSSSGPIESRCYVEFTRNVAKIRFASALIR